MKIQPLYDLQQDINRLFIAGSKFAKGDPRLQKHIAIFNKLGEKAPVFKKLATDIEELVELDQRQSGEKLMAISTLLYSVLYTQGEQVESDVEQKELEPNLQLQNINTEYSYLLLKPVIEALSTANSGRLEILMDAFERGIFKDSRTFTYLDKALGDKYSELCDYVEKKIIPSIGKPILPFLEQSFELEDRTENVRRLRLLHSIGSAEIDKIITAVFEKTLPNLQAEAINILSSDPKNEEFIIKLADDKNKIVREAAYMALANLNTKTSLEKLKDVYLTNKNKTNLPLVARALASTKLPFFFSEILEQVSVAFKDFEDLEETAEEKVLTDKLERLDAVLPILSNKDNDEVIALLENILLSKKCIKLFKSKAGILKYPAQTFTYSLRNVLDTLDKQKVLALWEKIMKDIPDSEWKSIYWENYLEKAIALGYSKNKLYDTFSQPVRDNIISIYRLHESFAINTDTSYYYRVLDGEEVVNPEKVDQRWIELLYDRLQSKKKWDSEIEYSLEILHACEPAKSKHFNETLIGLLDKVMPGNTPHIFKIIVDREIPNSFELVYSTLAKFQKNTYYYAFNRLKGINFWTKFPKEYAPKFRELAKKHNNTMYSDIVDEIEEIKSEN